MTEAACRERDYWNATARADGAAQAAWPEGGQMLRVDSAQHYSAWIWERIRRFVVDVGEPRVLEVGIGAGRLAFPIAARDPNLWVIGVDSSVEMVTAVNVRDAADGGNAHVIPVLTDGRTVPFQDGFFAAAYSMVVFQHLPYDAVRGYLAEVSRVLAPGGVFVFQIVQREDRAEPDQFLAHALNRKDVTRMIVEATAFKSVHFETDDHYSNWCWVSCVKA